MHFDFSGATLMLAYLQGEADAAEVLAHPAYQTVQHHSTHYGEGITNDDLEAARAGQPSAFYGLDHPLCRMVRSQALLAIALQRAPRWADEATRALNHVLPAETTDAITVYPIVGYDMGIGFDEAVCMNLSYSGYTEEPEEFLYFVVHECVHVLYERHHTLPSLSTVQTHEQWRAFFNLFLQNEGFAVYVPFALRYARGHLGDRDYRVLADPAAVAQHLQALATIQQALAQSTQLPSDDYGEMCFGPQRLTYRAGCAIIRRIEQQYGLPEVRRAFCCDGNEFWQTYAHLVA